MEKGRKGGQQFKVTVKPSFGAYCTLSGSDPNDCVANIYDLGRKFW